MSPRASSIIGWTCALLVAAFNLFAAFMKLFAPVPPGSPAEEMQIRLGMQGLNQPLGILELVIVVLFLWPRTSTVGFVLIIGYMGGVLATIITHGFTFAETVPIYVSLALLTACGWFRHPELTVRLLGKPVPTR